MNDLCADVVPVPLANGTSIEFTGDNTGATITGDYEPGSILASFNEPSVWHAFTTAECSDITLDYCGTVPAFTEYWNVLATTCPANNVLVVTQLYDNGACGDGNVTMHFNGVPPGTYLYPVWSEAGVTEGPYTINVSAVTCGGNVAPGDACAEAVPEALAVGATITLSGDNTNATPTGDFAQGSPFAGAPVVWHAFTTTECAKVTLSYCGLDPAWDNTFGFLSRDCPASDLVFFSNFNTTDCLDGNPTYIFNQLAAGTYLVPVLLDPGNNAIGVYDLQLQAEACSTLPTVSDFCSGVLPQALAVGAAISLSGDNTNATATGDFDPGSPFVGAPVMWHAFTTTECATVTLSYCGLDPTWDNTFGFLSRDCPASDLVYFTTFNTTACPDGNRTYIFEQLAAGTYLVPVVLDPGNNAIGPYDLLLQAEACPAEPTYSDLCSNAVMQPLAVGASISFNGDNTNATAAWDFDPGSPFAGAPVVWHGITTTECSNVTISYCGQDPVWANTFGFLGVECPVTAPVFFSLVDNTTCVDGNVTYIYNALPAGDYLIPVVLDAANDAIGPYTLTVSSTECPIGPPANDNCAQAVAQPLAVGTSLQLTGDNTNATSNGDFVPGSPFVAAPVTWHAFTTTECADVLLRYCGQSPSWDNTLGFFSTTCPGDQLVYFSSTDPASCGDGNIVYQFNDLDPGTYYVPVLRDPANNAVGPYDITLAAENCLFLGLTANTVAEMVVVPNPNDGHFFVRNVPMTGVSVRVLDPTGRVVHAQRIGASGSGLVEVGGSALVAGTYLVELSTGDRRLVQRVVVR